MAKGLRANLLAVTCLLLTALTLWPALAAADEAVRITGIPDENPTELQRKYKPMVDYLENELGTKVAYVPVTDYGAAVAALAAKKVDFAWLGGFTYVQTRIMAGAIPVAMRDIDRHFKSIFIAYREAGISKPEDFRGKTFAFGSKSSTSGHLMPRHFLVTTFHINPDTDFAGLPVFSGGHDATVKMVETGKVQGGVLNFEVWERMTASHAFDQDKVRVVWITPDYVDYVWTARKDLDPALVERFKEAFLKLDPNNPQHQAVLALQGAQKFVPASPADFDAIEQVGRSTGLLK